MESQNGSEFKSTAILTAIDFENTYKEANRLLLCYENDMNQGKITEINNTFQRLIMCLNRIIETKIETFDVGAETVQLYAEMQIKMKSIRNKTFYSSSDFQQTPNFKSDFPFRNDDPPSYEESMSLPNQGSAVSSSNSNASSSYPSLNDLKPRDVSTKNGELILKIDNGVQIFFIQPDGNVSSPSFPTFLAVVMFSDGVCQDTNINGARGFLQVGEWNYPLVPSQSPVLHSAYGAYMFPDLTSPIKDSSIGVIIPDSCSRDERELFEQILQQMTSYRIQDSLQSSATFGEIDVDEVKKSASVRIAEGAEVVAHGVVWGAEKLSELIVSGSEKLRKTSEPTIAPMQVDPKWKSTAHTARDVSGKAVKVSGFILNQVGKATMAVGRTVAPVIQKHGTKAIGRLTGQTNDVASKQVGGVMEVAHGAIIGASTIYLGLEKAAFMLAGSLTENTVKVVSHRYGDDMGSLTDNTLYAVGQTATVGYHISSMGVKGIAKRAAKDTGKALVQNYNPTENETEAIEFSNTIEKRPPT